MTLGELMNLYNHFQNYYDFTLSKKTYKELEQKIMEDEEWIPE